MPRPKPPESLMPVQKNAYLRRIKELEKELENQKAINHEGFYANKVKLLEKEVKILKRTLEEQPDVHNYIRNCPQAVIREVFQNCQNEGDILTTERIFNKNGSKVQLTLKITLNEDYP